MPEKKIEFSKWGSVFTNDQMTAAMIDRLVHHGHLFLFNGKMTSVKFAVQRSLNILQLTRKLNYASYGSRYQYIKKKKKILKYKYI